MLRLLLLTAILAVLQSAPLLKEKEGLGQLREFLPETIRQATDKLARQELVALKNALYGAAAEGLSKEKLFLALAKASPDVSSKIMEITDAKMRKLTENARNFLNELLEDILNFSGSLMLSKTPADDVKALEMKYADKFINLDQADRDSMRREAPELFKLLELGSRISQLHS